MGIKQAFQSGDGDLSTATFLVGYFYTLFNKKGLIFVIFFQVFLGKKVELSDFDLNGGFFNLVVVYSRDLRKRSSYPNVKLSVVDLPGVHCSNKEIDFGRYFS